MIDRVEELVAERHKALQSSNIQKAFAIKNELARFGVTLIDGRNGTSYKLPIN